MQKIQHFDIGTQIYTVHVDNFLHRRKKDSTLIIMATFTTNKEIVHAL